MVRRSILNALKNGFAAGKTLKRPVFKRNISNLNNHPRVQRDLSRLQVTAISFEAVIVIDIQVVRD